MGCNLSKSEHPPPAQSSSGLQLKFDKFRQHLKTEGIAESTAAHILELEQRCTAMEAELSAKMQELQFLKSEEAGASSRPAQKLCRKLTFHDGSGEEVALREIRAMVIAMEDENARLKGQLKEPPTSEFQTEEAIDLQLELDELRSDLSKLNAYNQKLLKEKVLLMFCSSLNINLLLALSFWKRGLVIPARSVCDVSVLDSDRTDVDKEAVLKDSPMYQSLGKVDSFAGRPMSRTSVILLFENLLDEKYEQDLRDSALGRSLKPVTEFVLEYMNRRHGLATMATKKTAQFIQGLVSMYVSGVAYAKVMCAMFNVIKGEQIHPHFSMFLTHVRGVFQTLKDKRRRPTERQRSATLSVQKQDFRREKYEYIDSGGSAPLVFVCDLIYSLFKDDPASGEMMLRLVKPPDLSIEDFIIFKICHKMAQDGCSPEELFRRLDLDGGGTIDHSEFQSGIQQLMGLWLGGEDLQLAMSKMSPDSGEIPREQFFKYINFDAYYNCGAWKSQNVSGANFLLGLLSVHQSVVEECEAAFRRVTGREEVEFGEFQRAVTGLDTGLTKQDVVRIYNAASVDRVDIHAFLDICENEYLGRFKSFSTSYADYRNLDTEPRKTDLAKTDCDTPKARDKKKGPTFRFNP